MGANILALHGCSAYINFRHLVHTIMAITRRGKSCWRSAGSVISSESRRKPLTALEYCYEYLQQLCAVSAQMCGLGLRSSKVYLWHLKVFIELWESPKESLVTLTKLPGLVAM